MTPPWIDVVRGLGTGGAGMAALLGSLRTDVQVQVTEKTRTPLASRNGGQVNSNNHPLPLI